jgi:hypothetical protein
MMGLILEAAAWIFVKHFLLGIPCRKPQNIAVASLHPLCRKPPQLAPKSRDIPMLNLQWQTQELESQNQVGSPRPYPASAVIVRRRV